MKKALSFITIGLLAAACSGGNSSSKNNISPQNGACSVDTVLAYREIKTQADLLKISSDPIHVGNMKDACKSYQKLIGNTSCKVTDVQAGEEATISYASRKALCESEPSTPAPTTVTAEISADTTEAAPPEDVIPVVESPKAKDLKKGIVLTVIDAKAINELLTLSDSAFVQNGEIIRKLSSVDRQKAFCLLAKKSSLFEVREQDKLTFAKMQVKKEGILLSTKDLRVSMSCGKLAEASEMKLGEIQEIFKGIAQIEAAL